jgi:exopolysaccharide biosynthesis polyprenyl glycosylphosphotransferase
MSTNLAKVETTSLSRLLEAPSFALHISERKLLLAIGDLAAMNAALFGALSLRERVSSSPESHLQWFLLVSAFWLASGLLFDIYDIARAASSLRSLRAALSTVWLSCALFLFTPYVTPVFPQRRLDALLLPLLATVGVGAWRLLYSRVFSQPNFTQSALIVGAGWAGQTLVRALAKINNDSTSHGIGYHILGFIDDEVDVGSGVEDLPVLGNRKDLVRLVQELRPDELVVAITYTETIHDEMFQAILDCREMGISVTTMPLLYEQLTGQVPIEHAGRALYSVFRLGQPATHRPYKALRRVVDFVLSSIGCVFTAALIPLVMLINRFCSPGPVFYRQERIGKGGRRFWLVKFRSMHVDAEKTTGAVWATEDDPRITAAGRLLRKTRLDEFPQFWNVLKGEMSLIGPRPERPEFVEQLTLQMPFYRVRHALRPGITGWAQVKYRYGASVEDSQIKLQYDLYYIRHEGPFLDVYIMLRTAMAMLGFKGR